MAADSYFEIGSSHLVCQDYALSGRYKEMSYGIISDGCSSANHSEIGAQVLCHVTKYYLGLYYDLFADGVDNVLLNLLGNSVLKRADELRKLYPINRGALQASLFVVVIFKNVFWVFGWGDGTIVFNCGDIQEVYELSYPETNAPFYLVTDRKGYEEEFGSNRLVSYRYFIMGEKDHGKIINHPYYVPFFHCDKKLGNSIDSITILTDGVSQYMDEERNPISVEKILSELIYYPNYTGVFVQRNMNFLKKDFARKGWTHSDDIGIATVTF